MFTPTTHHLVGKVMTYLPKGSSPYAPIPIRTGVTILQSGDPVTVQSAWDRDYLVNPPVLLYVTSHNTGESTHVIENDLIEIRGTL